MTNWTHCGSEGSCERNNCVDTQKWEQSTGHQNCPKFFFRFSSGQRQSNCGRDEKLTHDIFDDWPRNADLQLSGMCPAMTSWHNIASIASDSRTTVTSTKKSATNSLKNWRPDVRPMAKARHRKRSKKCELRNNPEETMGSSTLR